MQLISTMQIGKNGIDENFIETLKNHFKNHKNVKVAVLKSATREKIKIKEMAEDLVSKLGDNYNYRIVGFTIFLKKWTKKMR